MTTYAVNTVTGVSTKYTDYGFNSMFKGHDGKYYGVKADGLYLLEGQVDSMVDFGDLAFGTSALKRLAYMYVSAQSSDKIKLLVTDAGTTYEYLTTDKGSETRTHRVHPGWGMRSNYFGVKLKNTNGAELMVDSVEIAASPLSRRV